MTAVFLGDLTVDLIVQEDSPTESETLDFAQFDGPIEEWRKVVLSEVRRAKGAVAAPGGSIANAAAAYQSVAGVKPALFHVVAEPYGGTIGPELGDLGFEACAVDLKMRGVQVKHPPVPPSSGFLPGAIIWLTPSGRTIRIRAITQTPLKGQLPFCSVLVARADHLVCIDAASLLGAPELFVLLNDDNRSTDHLGAFIERGLKVTIIGSGARVKTVREQPWSPDCTVIQTNGSHPVVVESNGERFELEVEPIAQVTGDLGAGDAYLGGWVAASTVGGSIADLHAVACRTARLALSQRTARVPASADFNLLLPQSVDRSSPRDDEIALVSEVARAPGVALVSGGQTGVETWAVEAAKVAGVRTFVVAPLGLRRHDGHELDLREARLFELGSDSYRYRTWMTVFASDGVLLVDWHDGEGSEETRRAALHFGRPLLEVTKDTAIADVARWVKVLGIRSVLVAGNRESYFGTDRGAAIDAVNVCVAGLVASTAELLNGSPRPPDARRAQAVARGALLWWESTMGEPFSGEVLPAREIADGLVGGRFNCAVSWPALLPSTNGFSIRPLGAFPCHYGFVGRRPLRPGDRVGVQYSNAYAQFGAPLIGAETRSSLTIESVIGGAEKRILENQLDMVFDTIATGRSAAKSGLHFLSPAHWETVSLITRTETNG